MKTNRRAGLTLVELLVVLGIIGTLAGISTPLYVGWRAESLNAEAVRFVQGAISQARAASKESATTITLIFGNDQSTFHVGSRELRVPNRGKILTEDGHNVEVGFVPPFGSQQPFEASRFQVRTGSGLFERTATVTVVPPLGKTGVSR